MRLRLRPSGKGIHQVLGWGTMERSEFESQQADVEKAIKTSRDFEDLAG